MSKVGIFKSNDNTYRLTFYGLPNIALKVNKVTGNYYDVVGFSKVCTPMFKLNTIELKSIIEALHVVPGKSRKVSTLLSKYLENKLPDQIYSI